MSTSCHPVRADVPGSLVGYARWQQLLAAAFFRRGAPFMLFVDDDELQRLLPAGLGGAAASLSAAVAEEVDVDRGKLMFDRLSQKQAEWQCGDRRTPPPTLPLLALTVLAATRMHRDTENAANNFYVRLVQVLAPDADNRARQRIRTALREDGAFTQVVTMWRTLHDWLTSTDGEFGISTIVDHPDLTRIGFPLSQAVLRRTDRAELTRFFAALDLKSRGMPAPGSLLSQLRLWMARPRGFSEAFCETVHDPVRAKFLEPTIVRLAQHWDGRIVTNEGLRRLEIRLVLDLRGQTARWAITAADGVDTDVLQGEIDDQRYEVAISRDPYATLCVVDTVIPASPQALRKGVRLQGKQSSAYFPPSPVVVLAEDPDAGGWLSCHSVVPYEQHLIAACDELASHIERVLLHAADPGWRSVRQAPARQLLPGWRIFTAVTFSDAGRLDQVLSGTPVLRSTSVRPDVVARPQLVKGLPLARHLGRNFYLDGGEPDLLLPSGELARKVTAALDGVSQQPPFSGSGFPIPLRRIGPLRTGEHNIQVDGERLVFHILDAEPSSSPARWGGIGWDEQGELTDDRTVYQVCGAEVTGPEAPEPLLARRGQDQTWLLHHNGACQQVPEPAAASAVSRVLDAPSYYFELIPSNTAAWLAQRRGDHWRIQKVRPHEPVFTRLDPESRALWHQFARYELSGEPLWDEYRQEWERHRGR
ncbi:hypothetical protein L3Q67_32950 [Saccharothrix sp. AJ9571]|nr:hypothetical protein L3Q67_32950 [Saccharothrix sp. AJ9571]